MIKKIVWSILILSVLLSLVFITGFVNSINTSSKVEDEDRKIPKAEVEDVEKPPNTYSQILIMGDSIGFGIGDEENFGIGNRYLDLMDKQNKAETEITNISVPGYESNQLAELILSKENITNISDASLIIISIGGNDLNRLEYEDKLEMNISFEEALKNYRENLNIIVEEIRAVNKDAQLAFIGLYDPYSRVEPEKTRFLLEWNYETRLVVDSDSKFSYIPMYEEFEYHLDEYLSVDDFHPSGAGYQAIAESLYRILN